MATKHVAVIVVLLAILAALFPQYSKMVVNQFSGILLSFNFGSYISNILNSSPKPVKGSDRLFTITELASFNGEEKSPGLYLSVLGKVFDVKQGQKHYGPGGSYHIFAGRDGSAAFATGEFNQAGIAKNVLTLSDSEVKAVWDWLAFYEKDYKYKGKLKGQFYDENGEPTLDYQSVLEAVKRVEKSNESKKANAAKYPPCNMEWSSSGSRVWCSKLSGGIERDWVGVPRKYYEPGAESYRCACVPLSATTESTAKGMLKEYESCRPQAEACYVKPET